MMMETENTIDMKAFHIDALREVGNIAAAKASSKLTKLVGSDILIDVTDSHVLRIEDIPSSMGARDLKVVAIYMAVEEGNRGGVLLVFPYDRATWMADMMLRRANIDGRKLEDMDKEILTEIGNIVICGYLNVISNMLKLSLRPSPPGIAVDMLGPILQMPACSLGESGDFAIVLETKFVYDANSFIGFILYLPDKETKNMLLDYFSQKALKKPWEEVKDEL